MIWMRPTSLDVLFWFWWWWWEWRRGGGWLNDDDDDDDDAIGNGGKHGEVKENDGGSDMQQRIRFSPNLPRFSKRQVHHDIVCFSGFLFPRAPTTFPSLLPSSNTAIGFYTLIVALSMWRLINSFACRSSYGTWRCEFIHSVIGGHSLNWQG